MFYNKDMEKQRTYIAIDLKSFYASVECAERGLDPLTTNLVVADKSRTDKTICLAVSPSLKGYGVGGRPRLFEVVERVSQVNSIRLKSAPGGVFSASSYDDTRIRKDPSLKLDYIVATPRMARYIRYSADIYSIYMKYISPDDMHVYSIDEVFIDATDYLSLYGMSARELAMAMIHDVLSRTGVTATAGIGPNLYLCKIAMDIVAKHIPADEDGVRIAELDEMSYRRQLWDHTPLTDFWRIGPGYERRLTSHGLYTMGDVARCSLGEPSSYYNEDLLYSIFGINAELLIDHAWGIEPCTISDIKQYTPSAKSTGSTQVLSRAYSFEEARIIVREMTEGVVMELVEKGFVTSQFVLVLNYDSSNTETSRKIVSDYYGRKVPEHAQGSVNLGGYTSSTKLITDKVEALYNSISDPSLSIRRVSVAAMDVIRKEDIPVNESEQLDFFTDYEERDRQRQEQKEKEEKEAKLQEAMLSVRKKFGKNSVMRAVSLEDAATFTERNGQIGGHKA